MSLVINHQKISNPMSLVIPISDTSSDLQRIIERVAARGNDCIIEKDSNPIAAIIAIEKYERLRADRESLFNRIDEMRRTVADVPEEELDAAIEEAVRAAKRAELEILVQRESAKRNTYTALIKQRGPWWIGWIKEIPGVTCQESSREELLETLRITLNEAIEFNREDALSVADTDYTEEPLTL